MTQVAPIVEAKNLGRKADDGTWLLREVNFAIRPGDRLGIVGQSGSGKTVLLRSLAALDPIQSGQLLFVGRPVAGSQVPAYRTEVVYLQQRPVLFEGTVESNLKKPLKLAVHRDQHYQRQRVVDWLERLDRGPSFLDKQQHSLSGGELQIAALLRAMQLNPKILLLDEPTAALDAAATTAVERLLDRWQNGTVGQGAFVWITHAASQAERTCHTIYQMDAGKITHS